MAQAGKKGQVHSAKKAGSAKPASLKEVAEVLGLSAATVSVVLNNVPGRSIPQATRERVKAVAARMNYHPSLLARSLRNRRTHTVGVLLPELGDGYHAQVLSGIGDHLMQEGYFYFTAHHRHRTDLIEQYSQMLLGRGAEALIAVDTLLTSELAVPVVAVAGHRKIAGVTNVVLDHARAAELALHHLHAQGHRRIAFMRGQTFSSDSEERWTSLGRVAKKLGIAMPAEMVIQLDRDMVSPELGYPVVQQLLASGARFTALVSFNDLAAIGAIRALRDAGLRVPEDVSVLGFDDIKPAAFHTPSLTTIRQPLEDMGRTAARLVLERVNGLPQGKDEVAVEPELIVRESTGPVKVEPGRSRKSVAVNG